MIVAVALFVVAALLAVLATFGMLRRLPRNRFLGVRTRVSLQSDDAFALANQVAAPSLYASALAFAAAGAAVLVIDRWPGAALAGVLVVFGLGMAVVGGSLGARAAAALPAADDCGQTCASCTLKDACSRA